MKDYSVQLNALVAASIIVKVQGKDAQDAISNALLTTSILSEEWDLIYLDRTTIEGNALPYFPDSNASDEDFAETKPLMSLYPTQLEEF